MPNTDWQHLATVRVPLPADFPSDPACVESYLREKMIAQGRAAERRLVEMLDPCMTLWSHERQSNQGWEGLP